MAWANGRPRRWRSATAAASRSSEEIHFPHSLGLLYSAFTYYTGFKVNSGEYKVMGLAPYGTPKYLDLIKEKLVDIKDDGSFRLNMDYFDYCTGLTMTNARFDALFGAPPRRPEAPLTQREMDLAASVQAITEEIVLKLARAVAPRDGREEPLPRRRRGAQLRGQRQAAAAGLVRQHLVAAGRGRRRWRCRCGTGGCPLVQEGPRLPNGAATACRDRISGPPIRRTTSSDG